MGGGSGGGLGDGFGGVGGGGGWQSIHSQKDWPKERFFFKK